MAVQTEVEYASTGVDPILPQYASIAVGSPILRYSHINVGTTPEPESIPSTPSAQKPPNAQRTAASEPLPLPQPVPPMVSVVVAGHTMTGVIPLAYLLYLFLTEIS